jgi:hypothetical protein
MYLQELEENYDKALAAGIEIVAVSAYDHDECDGKFALVSG